MGCGYQSPRKESLMPKKRQMSTEKFAEGFAEIAADYLETVPVDERDEKIAALKNNIAKSGHASRPKVSRNAETPAIRLAARTCG